MTEVKIGMEGAEGFAKQGGWDDVDQMINETGLSYSDLNINELYFDQGVDVEKDLDINKLKKKESQKFFVYCARSIFIEKIDVYIDDKNRAWAISGEVEEKSS